MIASWYELHRLLRALPFAWQGASANDYLSLGTGHGVYFDWAHLRAFCSSKLLLRMAFLSLTGPIFEIALARVHQALRAVS